MNDFFYTWSKQRTNFPLPVERSELDEFILADGNRVYDFISTSFQASFGHSNQPIIAKIIRQLEEMPIASPKASFSLKEAVSKALIELTGFNRGKIFYTVSGAEAVENAIKIARQIQAKPIILARKRSYHGATLGAMSVSGDWRGDCHLKFTEGTVRIPEPDEDSDASQVREIVKSTGAEKIAAIIVESITGTNGVIIPPVSWFEGLRQVCDQYGLFLIFDEVLSGFYRCKSPLAFQQFYVRPDMICMSKAITGGYIPFGAVWVNQEIADYYADRVLANGLTNYAHPLGLAATGAVIQQILDGRFLAHLRQLEILFAERISELAKTFDASAVRCQGMLAAIEFGSRQLPAWHDWIKHHCYLFTKGNMLILAPPLITSVDRLNQAFDDLESGMERV